MIHTKSTRDKFERLVIQGTLNYDEIVRALSIGRRTAFRWRDEMSLPRRKRGPKTS